jgi:hypothetical protein
MYYYKETASNKAFNGMLLAIIGYIIVNDLHIFKDVIGKTAHHSYTYFEAPRLCNQLFTISQ